MILFRDYFEQKQVFLYFVVFGSIQLFMDKNRVIRDYNFLHPNRTGENRGWRTGNFRNNPRRIIEDRVHRKTVRRHLLWGVLSMVGIILILVFLLAYLLYDPVETSRICVPGFTGENCEKSNFLGTYLWSVNDYYILDDGLQHRSGIAFRVYAPRAKSVSVGLVETENSDSKSSSMI